MGSEPTEAEFFGGADVTRIGF